MVVTGPIMQPGFAGRYPLLAVELGARRRGLAARVELPRNNRSATKRGQWHILDTAVTIGDCRAEPPHCTQYYATRTRHAARCIRA
jgi:hypothetical protein